MLQIIAKNLRSVFIFPLVVTCLLILGIANQASASGRFIEKLNETESLIDRLSAGLYAINFEVRNNNCDTRHEQSSFWNSYELAKNTILDICANDAFEAQNMRLISIAMRTDVNCGAHLIFQCDVKNHAIQQEVSHRSFSASDAEYADFVRNQTISGRDLQLQQIADVKAWHQISERQCEGGMWARGVGALVSGTGGRSCEALNRAIYSRVIAKGLLNGLNPFTAGESRSSVIGAIGAAKADAITGIANAKVDAITGIANAKVGAITGIANARVGAIPGIANAKVDGIAGIANAKVDGIAMIGNAKIIGVEMLVQGRVRGPNILIEGAQ